MRRPSTLALAMAALVTTVLLPLDPAEARARGAKRTQVAEIIVHATGGPFCQGGRVTFSPAGTAERMKAFFERSGAVSIHYIVGQDGQVLKSVPEDEIAIHAVNHNDQAIGIELINAGDGREPYPEAQVRAVTKLIREIQARWRIPLAQVKGHEEVDRSQFACGGRQVRRKQDPGPLFPWNRVKAELRIAEGNPPTLGPTRH